MVLSDTTVVGCTSESLGTFQAEIWSLRVRMAHAVALHAALVREIEPGLADAAGDRLSESP
jgi:hypothetical protein